MEKSLLLSNLKEAEIRRASKSFPQIRSNLRLCAGFVLGLLGIVAFVLRHKLIPSKLIHVQDHYESHISWDDVSLLSIHALSTSQRKKLVLKSPKLQ